MQSHQILKHLKSLSDPAAVKGMMRFGIAPNKCYGISMPVLRKLAKEAGKSHETALKLWKSGINEARILASLVEEPERVDEKQADKWVNDFDSWDICDQCCMNLLYKLHFIYKKIFQWSKNERAFIKRAGFTIIAVLAVHDKEAKDDKFEKFFPLIKRAACDERNFVRKAVNWALRQIGKRNLSLNKKAIKLSEELIGFNSKSARWVGNNALRELTSPAIKKRLH
jgi:3-methyladenine DNA glycosylase AlkD